jgi:hypothetical protein
MKQYYVPYADDEEPNRLGWEDKETGEMKYIQSEAEARKMGKFDRDLYKTYNDRITRGLILFGKYYRGLWD